MVVWWNGIVPSGCHFLTCDDQQGLWRRILTYTDVGVSRGAHLWSCCSRLCLLSLSAHRSGSVDVLEVVFSQIWCHLSVLSGVLLFTDTSQRFAITVEDMFFSTIFRNRTGDNQGSLI